MRFDEKSKKTDGVTPTEINEIFWIERGDGELIPMTEDEASKTFKIVSSWKRNDFKLVGVSSGEILSKVKTEYRNQPNDDEKRDAIRAAMKKEYESGLGKKKVINDSLLVTPGGRRGEIKDLMKGALAQ